MKKVFARTLAVAIIFTLLLPVTVFAEVLPEEPTTEITNPEQETTGEADLGSQEKDYYTITSVKDAYQKIFLAALNRDTKSEFIISDELREKSRNAINDVLWNNGDFTLGLVFHSDCYGSEWVMGFKKASNSSQIIKNANKVNKKADQIVKKIIKKNMTDTQKARAIHDYIVENCSYQSNGYDQMAFGCLVKNKCVCAGYANAFNLLAAKSGIACIYESGMVSNYTVPHAWNYVLLDGKYRYIDVTWDDPIGYYGSEIRTDYFAVTKSQLGKNHYWDAKKYPNKYLKWQKEALSLKKTPYK